MLIQDVIIHFKLKVVLGPPLTKRTDSYSISYAKNILNGTIKEVDKSSAFEAIDVRDVAKGNQIILFKFMLH